MAISSIANSPVASSAVIFRKRKITTVGEENICDNVQDALRRAEEIYEGLEQKFVGAKA